MYPGTDITKAHLEAYYAAVAHRMLRHLKDRPLSLVRDTDNDLQKTFFLKHALPGMPKALHAGELTKMKGTEARILWIEDLSGLIGGVQMNTLGFHVWGSDRHTPDLPERMVFDIDPDESLDFGHVKKAATDIKDALGAIGLQFWPLVSGARASMWWAHLSHRQTGMR
jgi:bifunctional non-homologous end joining protein LigD